MIKNITGYDCPDTCIYKKKKLTFEAGNYFIYCSKGHNPRGYRVIRLSMPARYGGVIERFICPFYKKDNDVDI